jgi:membrane-associated protease RseP (regulator of RpoE activity)
VTFEIATRNGKIHYNSKNGFSPTLNIFVGSGVNLLIQTLTYGILKLIFGDAAYCYPISYFVHLFAFLATAGTLIGIGFWVYWKRP